MKKKWRYINEVNVNASYGLGADEYLMANSESPTLRLYTYKNYSVLAGRFQDIRTEIDIDKCEALGNDYNRRLTGGGAIIMGEDQLGICFAVPANYFSWKQIRELYELLSSPIIGSLQNFGIAASFRSKNDLEVNGKKIAGLGIHLDPQGNFHFHSSLLLDLDIKDMLSVLNIPSQKFEDKRMINSVEQRMTTVRKEIGKQISMAELKASIKNSFQQYFQIEWNEIPFSNKEKVGINKIETDRYLNSEWIFQRSAQEDMDGMSLKKTKAGLLRTYIALKGETIKSVLITGDFMEGSIVISRIEARLKWMLLDKEQIGNAIRTEMQSEDIELTPDDIIDAVWMAAQRGLAAARYTYKGSCYYPKEEKPTERKLEMI